MAENLEIKNLLQEMKLIVESKTSIYLIISKLIKI